MRFTAELRSRRKVGSSSDPFDAVQPWSIVRAVILIVIALAVLVLR